MPLFKALYVFSPEEADELHLQIGDIIDVDEVVDGSNWGYGKCQRTEKTGQFPWNYVEKIEQESEAPPPIVPRDSSATASIRHRYSASSASSRQQVSERVDYSGYPWYAPDDDRKSAESRIGNYPNGTFLVRPSKSHNGYSLSVKFEEVRHVMIIESRGKFGFSEPCDFDSVLALVEFFQRESLACYNAELETKLDYPYKTAPTQKAPPPPVAEDEDEEEDLYVSNREALRMQRQRREDTAQIKLQDYGDIYEEIREDQIKHKAQMAILMMLKEQRTLHEKIQSRGADHDVIRKNRDHLKGRLVDAERNLELIDSRLRSAREKHEAAQAKSGQADGGRGSLGAKAGFQEDIDRPTAESMLEGKEDGCYVIRRSKNRTSDPYTLSMRFDGKTRHIQIKFDGTRYGLAEPLAFYTIRDLCDYYSTTPLSSTITKCLTTAVNAK